jgi:hypothetical protein
MKAVTKFKRHSRSLSQQSFKSASDTEPRKESRTESEAKHHSKEEEGEKHKDADETHLALQSLEEDTRRLSIEQI